MIAGCIFVVFSVLTLACLYVGAVRRITGHRVKWARWIGGDTWAAIGVLMALLGLIGVVLLT